MKTFLPVLLTIAIFIVYTSTQLPQRSIPPTNTGQSFVPLPRSVFAPPVPPACPGWTSLSLDTIIQARKAEQLTLSETSRLAGVPVASPAAAGEGGTAIVFMLDGDDAGLHYTAGLLANAWHVHKEQERQLARGNADWMPVTLLALLSASAHDRPDIRRLLAAGPPSLRLRTLPNTTMPISPYLHIKHAAKTQVFGLDDFDRLILLDLDLILLGDALAIATTFPGFPPVFNANPDRFERFNSGVAVVRPSASLVASLAHRAAVGREPWWDSTDQSLIHVDLPIFALFPRTFCPKKRVIYEGGDERLGRLVRRTTSALLANYTSSLDPSPIHCVHWTGEKPWQGQGRPDLQALSALWYSYLGEHIPPTASWTVPPGDFNAKKMTAVFEETRRKFWPK